LTFAPALRAVSSRERQLHRQRLAQRRAVLKCAKLSLLTD